MHYVGYIICDVARHCGLGARWLRLQNDRVVSFVRSLPYAEPWIYKSSPECPPTWCDVQLHNWQVLSRIDQYLLGVKISGTGGVLECGSFLITPWHVGLHTYINPLKPRGRTSPLTSNVAFCVFNRYRYWIFKHGIYSPFFPLQNAVCFIILIYLVPVLFTFYIQSVLKLKT